MERAQKPIKIDLQGIETDYDTDDYNDYDGLQRTPINDLFTTDETGEHLILHNVKNWFMSIAVADNNAEKLRQLKRVFDTVALSTDEDLIEYGLGVANVEPFFFRHYLELAFEMTHREVTGGWHNESDEANRIRINRINTLRQGPTPPARLQLTLDTVQRYEETRDRLG